MPLTNFRKQDARLCFLLMWWEASMRRKGNSPSTRRYATECNMEPVGVTKSGCLCVTLDDIEWKFRGQQVRGLAHKAVQRRHNSHKDICEFEMHKNMHFDHGWKWRMIRLKRNERLFRKDRQRWNCPSEIQSFVIQLIQIEWNSIKIFLISSKPFTVAQHLVLARHVMSCMYFNWCKRPSPMAFLA